MKTDIEIAQEAKMLPITEIANKLGLTEDDLEQYGKYKAKISLDVLNRNKDKTNGKLILMTAVNPDSSGEGKSTNTVGLGQALTKLGKKTVIAMREPSLGPCFGVKGGAAGGGYSQVVPMDDINLHFTGDIHAITTAHNLLSAMLDNHLHQGNELNIDMRRIAHPRVIDLNERSLRNMVVGLGGNNDGVPRQDRFDISVASEVMACFCLSRDLMDLKERLGRIVVAYTPDDKAITAHDLHAEGAMAVLLKDAIKPNLVQTLENVPAIIHGGPFANIAHGCNSVIATKMAMKLADYVVTEAGFGADLGAEKFFDIKCRYAGIKPDAAVIIATVRALKMHGGVTKDRIMTENVEAVREGLCNLEKHIENVKGFGVPVVVAINKYPTDTDEEIKIILNRCAELKVQAAVSEVWAKGGEGGVELASKVLDILESEKNAFRLLYDANLPIKEKIEKIACDIYGAAGVVYSIDADKQIDLYNRLGYDHLPVCIAKTQYSLSDDPILLGRPSGFNVKVREIRLAAGAGFLVVVTGSIMTMPGLPKVPAAEAIDIDENGKIYGLF